MSDNKGQNEPSMEEILASIRRIIAEDGEPPPGPGAKPASVQPRGAEPSSDEVLELTEVVDEHGAVESVMQPPTPAAAEMPSLDPAPAPTPPAAEPFRPAPRGDRLISDQAAAQSIAALSALNQLGGRSEPGMTTDIPMGDGQRSIEEMVREMLRPLLKDWLDANLPVIIERVVKDEVARIVREVQGR